jgi:hypothetical protein
MKEIWKFPSTGLNKTRVYSFQQDITYQHNGQTECGFINSMSTKPWMLQVRGLAETPAEFISAINIRIILLGTRTLFW